MPGGPVLLRLDDRDDLGIDEDGVGCGLVLELGRQMEGVADRDIGPLCVVS